MNVSKRRIYFYRKIMICVSLVVVSLFLLNPLCGGDPLPFIEYLANFRVPGSSYLTSIAINPFGDVLTVAGQEDNTVFLIEVDQVENPEDVVDVVFSLAKRLNISLPQGVSASLSNRSGSLGVVTSRATSQLAPSASDQFYTFNIEETIDSGTPVLTATDLCAPDQSVTYLYPENIHLGFITFTPCQEQSKPSAAVPDRRGSAGIFCMEPPPDKTDQSAEPLPMEDVVPVGYTPQGIDVAQNGSLIVVANHDPDPPDSSNYTVTQIPILSTTPGEIFGEPVNIDVNCQKPSRLTITPDISARGFPRYAYITCEASNSVVVVDVKTKRQTAIITQDRSGSDGFATPHGIDHFVYQVDGESHLLLAVANSSERDASVSLMAVKLEDNPDAIVENVCLKVPLTFVPTEATFSPDGEVLYVTGDIYVTAFDIDPENLNTCIR